MGSGEHDAVVFSRLALTHELARHVVPGADRVAFQRIAPAAAAGGAKDHAIAVMDPHIIDFSRRRLAAAVLAPQPFLRAGRRPAAENAPGLGVVAIVVDRNLA